MRTFLISNKNFEKIAFIFYQCYCDISVACKKITMKKELLFLITSVLLLIMPIASFAQITPAPVAGTTSNFVLFTTSGAITNAGITSIYSGSVGTNDGALTGFENLITQPTNLYAVTPETAQCAVDLSALYTNLMARTGT